MVEDQVHPIFENMELNIFSESDFKRLYRRQESVLHKLDPDRPLPEGTTSSYKPGVTKERWF